MGEGSENNGRDAAGRFAVGNPGGPGSRRRPADFRRAVEDAITPEHMIALFRRALRMALEGNLPAMRFVAERTLGRPAEATPGAAPLEVVLPRLEKASDCSLALQRVVDGLCKGTIDPANAKLLIDAIQVRVKAIEVNELEARLAELEKTAAVVDQNPGRGRR